MLDRERILSKVSDLDGYLRELATLAPKDFEAYQRFRMSPFYLETLLIKPVLTKSIF